MRNQILRLAVLAGVAFGMPAQAAQAGDPPSLVGSWRLVSYVDTPIGEGPIRAFGEQPIGLFVFTADGHVSIAIMRNPPDGEGPKNDVDPDACVPEWYCAYFGTYRVDSGQLITRVVGGNIPSFLATEQRRAFVIEGDRLVFTADYDADDGRRIRSERILVRSDAEAGD